jgi:hypothetical protein
VNNREDVLSVIQAHASRAMSFEGFLESLKTDHHGIPCWSLQAIVNSYRVVPHKIETDTDSTLDSNPNPNSNPDSYPNSNLNNNAHKNDSYNNDSNNNDSNTNKEGAKRCQIRVYVAYCATHLYMYDTYEARMPSWDVDPDDILIPNLDPNPDPDPDSNPNPTTFEDIDQERDEEEEKKEKDIVEEIEEEERKVMTLVEFEEYCCNNGNARPYNQDRNKTFTERFIFDEFKELLSAKEIIRNCVKEAMVALRIAILHKINSDPELNSDSNPIGKEMAIAGIDLMIDVPIGYDSNVRSKSVLTAYILEINNNPAMPGENKRMSVSYKEHLITFVKNLLLLGVCEDNSITSSRLSQLGFELVW